MNCFRVKELTLLFPSLQPNSAVAGAGKVSFTTETALHL